MRTTLEAEHPELAAFLLRADHVDVHRVRTQRPLRAFIAATFAYQPRWIAFLYAVRKRAVRLIGLGQEGVPEPTRWRPEDVPMQAGQAASFFTVQAARENELWIASAEERHLRGTLAVLREAGGYALVTIVHYRHWTGRLYFNLIRPFHHLVVMAMARAGAAQH
jgi:hypothetical protein